MSATLPEEVNSFIREKSINNLVNALPSLINDVFGEVSVIYSITEDIEEGWENLLITINARIELDVLLDLEDELVNSISAKFSTELNHVTVLCV